MSVSLSEGGERAGRELNRSSSEGGVAPQRRRAGATWPNSPARRTAGTRELPGRGAAPDGRCPGRDGGRVAVTRGGRRGPCGCAAGGSHGVAPVTSGAADQPVGVRGPPGGRLVRGDGRRVFRPVLDDRV